MPPKSGNARELRLGIEKDGTVIEIPLTGGNMNTGVVRIGQTVRRPTGPWTPAVHAVLNHLNNTGYPHAPQLLGIDDQGREVLSYHPGATEADVDLTRVGHLIRAFHDLMATFTPPADAVWQRLIPPNGEDLVIHHDLAPWNLVVGPELVLIDWDVAGPGTRLWDLAYAAHGFVPLSPTAEDPAERLRVLVDAYGLDEPGRRELAELLAPRTWSMYHLLATESARGVQPWTRLWNEGHGDVWRADAEFIEERADMWTEVLTR
ncbi:hypothetical protein GCM10029964_107630 [Kibdelosporangium lantanae]